MRLNKTYAQTQYNITKVSYDRWVKYIVVHYTGTNASASNNCRYFGSGNHNASADYFIDKDGEIYLFNGDLKHAYSWHCGGGKSLGPTNENSIGIEVVNDGGSDFTREQVEALHELVVSLRKAFKVPIDNVVRHYDCNTIRKQCPLPYINRDKWNRLHNEITMPLEEVDIVATKEEAAQAAWDYSVAGTRAQDRLAGIDAAANATWNTLGRRDDGGTGDGTEGDIYTRIAWIDMRVRNIEAKLNIIINTLDKE